MLHGFAQQAPPNTETHNFSLAECINYAYEHQDSVKNAQLDIKKAEYKVKETTGIGLPQVNGSASFQDYLKSPTQLFPDFISPLTYGVLNKEGVKDGNGNVIQVPTNNNFIPVSFNQKYSSNIGLAINQIIFNGSYLVGLQASKTYKELSNRNLIRTRIETNVNVTKAYYQVLVSNEQLKLLDANIKQLKEQYDQTAAQNKQGFVELIDVQRLEVQYNNLITSRENTISLLALNSQLLKFQMGMPIENQIVLTDKLEDIKLNPNIETLAVDTAFYHNRIEYNLAETGLELNKLDLKNKKSTFLPSLSANGNSSLSYQDNSFGNLFSKSYPATYVGLSLNIPIFSGGQRINQVRQSQIEVQKSQNNLDNLKNALSLQANQANIMFTNGLRSLENQKKNQALAKEVLRVAKIKYPGYRL